MDPEAAHTEAYGVSRLAGCNCEKCVLVSRPMKKSTHLWGARWSSSELSMYQASTGAVEGSLGCSENQDRFMECTSGAPKPGTIIKLSAASRTHLGQLQFLNAKVAHCGKMS